ncbi:MAG: hypothetical protein H7Y42_08915 [Chitinophagaceae bacterium]|nr:hypothetical protein [Chitinophagaceae bacterium]
MKTFLLSPALLIIMLLFGGSRSSDAIQIDGVVNQGEWEGAKERPLSGGGKVFTKLEKNILFIALVGNKKAWSHVYLVNGDTVRILHASAALGEARYVKRQDVWRSTSSFQWQLRERDYNLELEKKQQEHFVHEGWVANNNNLGNGMVFEFKIDLSRISSPLRWACVLAEVPLELHYYPTDLKDNTTLPRLVQGYTPDSLRFNPQSWESAQ